MSKRRLVNLADPATALDFRCVNKMARIMDLTPMQFIRAAGHPNHAARIGRFAEFKTPSIKVRRHIPAAA